MVLAVNMPLPGYRTSSEVPIPRHSRSQFPSVCLQETAFSLSWSLYRSAGSIRSSADSSSNSTSSGTRLIRAAQTIQMKLSARIKELRRNLPMKILFFLVGFYCATAFATVIGQTGDWDILSAALAVVVVEGIGALMYRGSLPLLNKGQN